MSTQLLAKGQGKWTMQNIKALSYPKLKKCGRFVFSAASLIAGILVAVLIQAAATNIYDNFQ